MSRQLDALVRLLDDAVEELDATQDRPSGRVPPTALRRGDAVVAAGGEPRIVSEVEPITGEVRIVFEAGNSVVVPGALTVQVRRS